MTAGSVMKPTLKASLLAQELMTLPLYSCSKRAGTACVLSISTRFLTLRSVAVTRVRPAFLRPLILLLWKPKFLMYLTKLSLAVDEKIDRPLTL